MKMSQGVKNTKNKVGISALCDFNVPKLLSIQQYEEQKNKIQSCETFEVILFFPCLPNDNTRESFCKHLLV